jgi:signal transduction histidine kinase
MRRLVDDLLDLTSLEAGHLSVALRPHELREVLDEAAELLTPIAGGKNIALKLDVGSDPCRVYCDRARVIQVLSNVVGNAIKFTPDGGAVTVTAEVDGDSVRVSIKDTGPGIPEASLRQIFDRYWQGRGGAHREAGAQKGRGLGLYIAKGIVEAQGGTIWADSRVGEGSTFHFTLPLAAADGVSTISPTMKPQSGSVGEDHGDGPDPGPIIGSG